MSNGGLDAAVFCRHAGGAGLQQVVEAGVFLYQVMRAVGQESADVLQVDRRNLPVEAAV